MQLSMINFFGKQVPRLIFGSLTMAPLQRNLSPDEGGAVIAAALQHGLRWIDTAQMYGSYPHVRKGVEISGINREQLVISTKSTAKSFAEMDAAVDEALQELNVDCIDLFLLHAVRSADDFRGRDGALQALLEARQNGRVKSIGVSTHSISCAELLAADTRFDWYHLIFNSQGIGLTDGTLDQQIAVIKKIRQRGARIYAMKPLGGGYLAKDAEQALLWIKDHPLIDGVALGMMSKEEVEMNINLFAGLAVSHDLKDRLSQTEKKLFIFKPICTGCGACESSCEQSAIRVVDQKAEVIPEKCIRCGYCVPACPQFALRII